MFNVLFSMAGLILCGIAWRLVRPAGLEPMATRKVLTSLVFYLLLPALVLSVIWRGAEVGANSLYIALAAASGVATGLLLGWTTCRTCRSNLADSGAIILAIAFPNVTYMGLPVLEATFGPWARSVAIQYDMFSVTPLLFTVGILLAARYGQGQNSDKPWHYDLLRIPALWATLIAVALNLGQVPQPESLADLLQLLGRGVVPLMLISLGLSLEWKQSRWHYLPKLVPVVLFKLLAIPAVVMLVANQLGMLGELRAAVVMEAAMPSVVIGLVICDRFNLNVGLYAAAVTVTTVVSLVTLPLWYGWLM